MKMDSLAEPSNRALLGHTTKKTHENEAAANAHRIYNPVRPRLLPLKQAAEYLGLTIWAMRERIYSGHIPFVMFRGGRKKYIDIRDLDGFIDKNKQTFG